MAWHSSVPVRILILVVLFASLAVVAAEATLVAEPAEAIPMHTLDVTLYPGSLDAKITNDQLGAVTFGGNVTIDKPQGVERVTVTLTADTNKGWPVVISPQTIAFINPDTTRFTVTVIVPEGTPPVVGTVTVFALAKSPIWSETQTTEARVNVLQFYEFEIWFDGYMGDGVPGESISGVLVIFNNGTGEDNFIITVQEVPKMVKNLDVPESITIPSRMEMEVQFTFDIDDGYDVPFEGEMYTIEFKVRSAGREERGILHEYSTPYYIHFEGLESKLLNDWPTYVGYGVVIVLASVVSVIIFKRVRRNKAERPEPEGTKG